jgi:hypothetical protein
MNGEIVPWNDIWYGCFPPHLLRLSFHLTSASSLLHVSPIGTLSWAFSTISRTTPLCSSSTAC